MVVVGAGTAHRDNEALQGMKENLIRVEALLRGQLPCYPPEVVTDSGKAKAVRAMSAVRYGMSAIPMIGHTAAVIKGLVETSAYLYAGVRKRERARGKGEKERAKGGGGWVSRESASRVIV